MATVEIEMIIKLCEEEMKALQKLLYFQYHNPSDAGLSDGEKDLVNGVFFAVNQSLDK